MRVRWLLALLCTLSCWPSLVLGQTTLQPGTYMGPLGTTTESKVEGLRITVPSPPDTTPPTLSSIQVAGITQTTATITFAVSEPARTRVKFGLTTEYTLGSTPLSTLGPGPFSVTLTGLPPGGTIHYQVEATDAANNLGVSADSTFQTQAQVATLTVIKAGTGSGMVAGQGIDCGPDCSETVTQGTVLTLTATPTGTDVFTGWSGGTCTGTGGCTVTVSSNTTVTATFDLAAPPSGGPGTWVKRAGPTYPPFGWYWEHAFVIDKPGHADHGKIWTIWDQNYLLNPSGWTFQGIGLTGGKPENFGSDFDPVSGLGWVGAQAGGPGAHLSVQVFDPVARSWTDTPAVCPSNAVMAVAPQARKLYCFGGWSSSGTAVKDLSGSIQAPWTTLSPSPGLPAPITDGLHDGARMSMSRGGIDRRTERPWIIDNNQDLREYNPATNQWTVIPTTGTKPPDATAFSLNEQANTIVGYNGCVDVVVNINGGCNTYVGDTYLLDLTTKQWRMGPPRGQGPTMQVMSGYIPLYDRVGKRTLLLVSDWQGTWVWEWVPSSGGAGSPVMLSTTKTGAGDGTVSGGGSYLPGTPVSVTATPNLTSTVSSVLPSDPCDTKPTFPMPSKALTCTAVFAKKDVPIPPLTGRFFTPNALPAPVSGQVVTWAFLEGGDTKDVPCVLDTTRTEMLCGTGDFLGPQSNSGQNLVFASNITGTQRRTVATYCQPAGQVTPNHSTDKGPFFYRKLDDALYVNVSASLPDQVGQTCTTGSPSGSTYVGGFLKLDLKTQRWSSVYPSSLGSLNIGRYDEATDTHLFIASESSCGGAAIMLLKVAPVSLSKAQTICTRPDPAFPAVGGYLGPQLAGYLQNFAWDALRQKAYIVLTHAKTDASQETVTREAFLWIWDRTTNSVMQGPKPPVKAGMWGTKPNVNNSADYTIDVHWMEGIGVVWPVFNSPCSKIQQMLVYNPDTKLWSEAPLVDQNGQAIIPYGSSQMVWGDQLFLAGEVFCQDKQNKSFVWGG